MIIRRKHTANFTTIGNALFNDERLAADEVGILAFLLSRPHDWEVRRPALARRWKLGRDSIKRIIHSAMRTGWITAQKTRLSNGSFHVIYVVRDEPGPEQSDEEIKAALSLVSSGAGQDETTDDEADDVPPAPEGGHAPPTENPSWGAPQPSLAQPSTVNPSRPSKILERTDSQRKESTNGARAYSELKAKWPAEHVLSDVTAQAAFLDLNDADAAGCIDGASPYLADCAAQNRKVCDLTTFIRERRWERFQRPAGQPALTVAKFGTPQFFRWREFYEATGEWNDRRNRFAEQNGGISVPSEWPPAQPTQKAG
jgi:hypothetical protein